MVKFWGVSSNVDFVPMTQTEPLERFYSVQEIAKQLGFSTWTVRKWIRDGDIPKGGIVVIAGEARVPWSTLGPWLEARKLTRTQLVHE